MNVEQDLRSKLATAIAERDASRKVLADANQAIDRGQGMVEAAESRLAAAEAATAASRTQRAQELAASMVEAGTTVLASPTRDARIEEADARDDFDAACAALAGLQKRLGDAEDGLRAADHKVVATADAVIRSVGEAALTEACEAALRLQRCRILMHFLLAPERAGQPVIMGVQRPVFGEEWADSVRTFGQERASRRARADEEARKMRDDPFAALRADLERHLDRALQGVHDGEQRWNADPSLTPWIEARDALMRGPDAPLPA